MGSVVESSVKLPVRTRVYGVDFSGARAAGHKIWITRASICENVLHIEACAPATLLLNVAAERTACLKALRTLISHERKAIFGLDFPFGVPSQLVKETSWEEYLRAFPERYVTPQQFRVACYLAAGERELKRLTDYENSAPWASYNLRLYRQTFYGIAAVLAPLVTEGIACALPMQRARANCAWLVEICPAATLKRYELYTPYKGGEARHRRARIMILEAIEHLAPLQLVEVGLRNLIVEEKGGDALDSVVAAWATWVALQKLLEAEEITHPLYVLEGYIYS